MYCIIIFWDSLLQDAVMAINLYGFKRGWVKKKSARIEKLVTGNTWKLLFLPKERVNKIMPGCPDFCPCAVFLF